MTPALVKRKIARVLYEDPPGRGVREGATPLQHHREPEDIASIRLQRASGSITGQTIVVNRGTGIAV